MNIYQRLDKVRQAVDYIQKDAKVESYKAITHDQVTAHTRPHFIEQGIVLVPSLVSQTTVPTGTQTSRGTPIIRHEAVYSVAFVNIDEPADSCTVTVCAHANDQGDKAPSKAISMAVKYAILKVLSIETGEGDEGRIEEAPQTISRDQHEALIERAEKYKWPAEETLDNMAHRVYKAMGLKNITELPADRFDQAMAKLDKKHDDEMKAQAGEQS